MRKTRTVVEIQLNEHELNTLVYALIKASMYENEYWKNLAERTARGYDDVKRREQCASFSNNARYYAEEHSKLIQKLCRCRMRRQGGIYRKGTMDMMRSALATIHKDAEDSIKKARRAILGEE